MLCTSEGGEEGAGRAEVVKETQQAQGEGPSLSAGFFFFCFFEEEGV